VDPGPRLGRSDPISAHLRSRNRAWTRRKALQRGDSEIPVTWARRRCLYDHLQCLADWLRELGHEDVRIELDDDALSAVEA
jgi:hypothetical protein